MGHNRPAHSSRHVGVALAGLSLALAHAALGAADGDEGTPSISQVFELNSASAQSLAVQMGGEALEDELAAVARRAAARRGWGLLAAMPGPWMMQGDALQSLLPEGLDGPPLALPGQNALLVKGTAQAIDEFAELLELLDRPTPMVRVEVDAVSTPQQFDFDGVLRWQAIRGHVQGAVGFGDLRVGVGDIDLATSNLRASMGIGVAGGYRHEKMMVTTESGSPAVIAVGTEHLTPMPVTAYDAFGNAYTGYQLLVTDVMTGLFVLPRVNANRTVTMYLSPVFDRPAGEVAVPGGGMIPVVERLSEMTTVTVADGQTVVIGGIATIEESVTFTGGPMLSQTEAVALGRQARYLNVTLLVTPHILPPPSPLGMGEDPLL